MTYWADLPQKERDAIMKGMKKRIEERKARFAAARAKREATKVALAELAEACQSMRDADSQSDSVREGAITDLLDAAEELVRLCGT